MMVWLEVISVKQAVRMTENCGEIVYEDCEKERAKDTYSVESLMRLVTTA